METTIRRPDAPDHFMILRPISRRIVIRLPNNELLAETNQAVRVIESGRTIYDPVVYVPVDAIKVDLEKQDNQTHCPLKGDASYYSYGSKSGTIENLAWAYDEPFDFSREIKGLIGFYPDKVVVEEHPR